MNTPAHDTAHDTAPLPLAAFLAQAWEQHADHPQAVAAGLQARAAALSADDEGADALRLAEHVWLSHLHDRGGFESFIGALPPALPGSAPTAEVLQRAHWVLSMLDGQLPPPMADAARWRGMQPLWAMWAAQGRAADAAAMLHAEAPKALAHPEAGARRALAASCNNLAGELQESPRGDAGVDALMLLAATEAARLWRSAGTWVHSERAEYRLARCHAVLGQGDEALRHATACLAAVDAHADQPEADAFERFFAHEALAWAHHARGDAAAVAAQLARMSALRDEVGDQSLRDWCTEALDHITRAVGALA